MLDLFVNENPLVDAFVQVQMVDKDLYESLKQELRPETHEHLVLLSVAKYPAL